MSWFGDIIPYNNLAEREREREREGFINVLALKYTLFFCVCLSLTYGALNWILWSNIFYLIIGTFIQIVCKKKNFYE